MQTAYVHEFVDPFSLAIIPPYASMTKQFNAALIGNEDCPILVTVNQWFYFNNETEIESFTAMWDLGQFTHQANCHNNASFELPEFWQDVVRQHEIAAADSPTAEQIAKVGWLGWVGVAVVLLLCCCWRRCCCWLSGCVWVVAP